ncbi:MAG: DNA primase [Deltaproteobacteria bacterium]|nr:DNA primase [Deltaproteobacteria bacterium]
MNPANAKLQSKAKVDFALLLGTLRARVLRGEDMERSARILANESVWKVLPPNRALEWALLAQSAGLLDLAVRILGHINAAHPEFAPAWAERAALLTALGRGPEAMALTKLAPDGVDLSHVEIPTRTESGDDPVPDGAFRAARREDDLLRRYLDVFRGREDCFARQWANRNEGTAGYVPVRRPMTSQDLRDHLQGRKTYGVYLMEGPGTVRLGVIDADLAKSLRTGKLDSAKRSAVYRDRDFMLNRVPEVAAEAGLSCLTEFSGGKGFHFWFAFEAPVPAARVRHVLGRIATVVGRDLTAFNLEVFPKQDKVGEAGLGNLVKLPMGLHRVSGKASEFWPKVRGDVWARLEAGLGRLVLNPASGLDGSGPTGDGGGQVLEHPRFSEWTATYPELALVSERCPALAGLLASCREGRGLTMREEKIVYGVFGFLTRARTILHHALGNQPEYNPHLVDLKLSRLRGTPLGCRRIHELLGLTIDYCPFEKPVPYAHPLLHCPQWSTADSPKAERVNNLQDALDHLRASLDMVARFLPARS